MLFSDDGTHCFARKTSRDYEKPSPFFDEIYPPIATKNTRTCSKKTTNWFQIWKNRMRFLLVDDLNHIFIFQIILFNFNLQLTYTQLTQNHHDILISNDGIQWTLDFGPDSVTIAVKDRDQYITISSQEKPLAAWQLLLSRRQDFLNEHLARVPITPNQEGTMEMRDELLFSMGAHDLDTSSYQVSDLEDIEFNWENSQLEMDAAFRPSIDTPFSPTKFDDLSMEGSVENPVVLEEEEDKKNAPPPSTPESVRPTHPPRLHRSHPFWTSIESVPDYIYENVFQ